jgi:CBS domain-containing protein
MTQNPTYAFPFDTAQSVAQLMISESVGPIPIVADESSKKLIGLVTDRDLAVNVVAEGRDPRNTTVENIMTRDLVTCRPGDDVRQAMEAMKTHQVRRIPIVSDGGKLEGIIAQADIATRVSMDGETADVVEEISEPRGNR